jgi:asparagine synthase (glutamine-hydrolysing)
MCREMLHRGPDDQGIYFRENIGLGVRRLSIIDLEGGRQPISNEDRTIWIVFNGEIYNYRELRLYLEKRGHLFSTQSDTEVIVHLYEEFGESAFDRLDGIFAFAIWDANTKQIWLVRDRLGIKPLYYCDLDGRLVFGSELKVLLAHPGLKREVNPVSLNEYLSFEYVPTPNTILKGVNRLPPGHFLLGTEDGISINSYWEFSLDQSENHPPVDWRDYAAGLRRVLGDTVRRELVSDVPVGVFLSGGIDSSAITAFMVEAYGREVNSFSIGFADKSFDESSYARLVADKLGTRHHEMIVTSQMAADMVPDIVDFLDEPFGDSSFIPTFLVSRLAAQQLKVVLGGDGGDELFAGYPTLIAHRLIEYYERVVPWTLRARLMPGVVEHIPVSFSNISLDFKLRRFLAGRGVPYEVRHHRWLGSFTDQEKARLLQEWVKPILGKTYATAHKLARECTADVPLNKVLYMDMKLYLEGDILFKVDRASMANSLEVRVPFLNREVVEFVSHMPLSLKLRGLTGKYILKKSMAPYLSKKIIDRPKKGFNMPVAHWINGELRELVYDMLSREMLSKHDFFSHDYVQRLLNEHASHQADHRKLIWTLLIFQMWYVKYMSH